MIKKLFFTVALLAPCLAHANIPPFVSSFSGQIVPATPTCQLGNHGLVRGRPIIANGTILAEDGCPLRGAIDEGQSICVGYSDLNWYKNSQSVINLNAIVGGWPIQDPFCGGVQTLAQIYAVIDAQLSNVSQTGQYLVISFYNRYPGGQPWTSTNCPDWNDAQTFWSNVSARYANDTNVIFSIMNEPDWQPDCPTPPGALSIQQIAANELSIWSLIRSNAPNSPILVWSTFNPDNTINDDPNNYAFLTSITYGPSSHTIFDFHNYGNASYLPTLASNAANETIPLSSTEGQSDNTHLSTIDGLGIAWFMNQALPESGVPTGVTVFWPKD